MINISCPCCGNEFNPFAGLPEGVRNLSPQQLEIVQILALRPGEYMSIQRIADLLYADTVDGGPLNYRTVIQKQVYEIRKRAGDIIDSARGFGYRLKRTSAMVAEAVTEGNT